LTPQPDAVHDVPTEFGTVRMYQHGPRHGIPVVLIHGLYLTSAMWWEQVAGLNDDFTVWLGIRMAVGLPSTRRHVHPVAWRL
jgi:pimeloyl-ACP methyl ester carboxylesterase